MAGKPEGYEEVADRVHRFYREYPQGSIRTSRREFVQVGGKDFILMEALVYRNAEDRLPGTGTSMEPIPGLTPFTRGSEVENCETSVWGRALASIGMGGKKIATTSELAGTQVVAPTVEMSEAATEFVKWFKRQKITPEALKLTLGAMGVAVGNKRFNTVVKGMTDDQIVALKGRLASD